MNSHFLTFAILFDHTGFFREINILLQVAWRGDVELKRGTLYESCFAYYLSIEILYTVALPDFVSMEPLYLLFMLATFKFVKMHIPQTSVC